MLSIIKVLVLILEQKKARPQSVLPEPERISKKGRPNTTDEYFQSVVLFFQQHDDEQVGP